MRQLHPVRCDHDGTVLEGLAAVPEGVSGPLPTVMVMHSALGLGEPVKRAANRLADLGYLAIATDMYGVGADISSDLAAGAHFQKLVEAPDRLRARTVAWFETIAARPDVDASRIAAIGYCFGGQCVLELARSGADLKAAVSYHGLLTTHAPAQPGSIGGEVALYCGGKDPYAPAADIDAIRGELDAAGARHQIMVFKDAEHGFTDPAAAESSSHRPGIRYHRIADRVSWAGTIALLDTVLRDAG